MHTHHIDYGPRYLGAAVLSAGIILLATMCWKRFRHGGRQRLLAVLYGYNVLLMALFIVGLLADDGYGWAFVPLMICTAPWSFLAPAVVHGTVGNWFASGLTGNFVLFVVLCGGINSLLLYVVIRRTFYAADPPAR